LAALSAEGDIGHTTPSGTVQFTVQSLARLFAAPMGPLGPWPRSTRCADQALRCPCSPGAMQAPCRPPLTAERPYGPGRGGSGVMQAPCRSPLTAERPYGPGRGGPGVMQAPCRPPL